MVDIKYTQNLYTNEDKLKSVVHSLSLRDIDTVLDIGAGKGVITKELIKYCKNVIAYELDPNYFSILEKEFKDIPTVILKNENFLSSTLPSKEYKVFANIPFSLTSDIINKITSRESNLVEAYLFIQKESAQRFIGKPINTQISSILSSLFSFSILDEFKREDFNPIPNIDIVLLKIVKKEYPEKEFNLYRDFITYVFNQRNSHVLDTLKNLFTYEQLKHVRKYLNEKEYIKPSDIPSEYFLDIFQYFKNNGNRYQERVKGYYEKHSIQHSKREKVNRTRIGIR